MQQLGGEQCFPYPAQYVMLLFSRDVHLHLNELLYCTVL
jgi:hypothetical protein